MKKRRRTRLVGHVTSMGEKSNGYRIAVGKPERKGPPGRSRSRWENTFEMDLEVSCGGVD
jgi:hypothetical protein